MKSLSKLKDVLHLIAAPEGATLAELSAKLPMPKTTIHRILRALEGSAFILRLNGQNRYYLGPFIRNLAGGSRDRKTLIAAAHPFMLRLRDVCNETVALHVLEARSWIAIHQVESTQELRRTFTNIGAPMPLHAAATGKLFLAYMPDRERQIYFKENALRAFTPNTITNRRRLLKELSDIVSRGYATSFQEAAIGVAGISMPLHAAHGEVQAAIGVSGPISRFTPKAVVAIRDALGRTISEVEQHLGGTRPDHLDGQKLGAKRGGVSKRRSAL